MPPSDPLLSRDPDPRVPWWLEALPVAALALGLFQLAVFVTQADLWTRMYKWFWVWLPQEVGPTWVVAMVAVLPLLSWALAVRLGPARPWGVVATICVLFTFGQHGWSWVEGEGLDGMREHIARAGHMQFAELAVEEPSMWRVASRYEELVQVGEIRRFARSKPPGTLLFYMATERLARPLAVDHRPESRLAALHTFAAITWPLLASLALFPLFGLGRRLTDDRTALLAVVLYTATPAATHIAMHLDKVLFPLVFTGIAWLAVEAVLAARARTAWALGAAAGALAFVGLGLSFVLGFALPVAGAAALGAAWRADPSWRVRGVRLVRALVPAVLAGGLLFGLAWLVAGYDPLVRFQHARTYHEHYKGWDGTWRTTVHFGALDALEWGLWAGLPVAALWLQRSWQAVREGAAGLWSGVTPTGGALLLVMGWVVAFGHTKGETARLWLPWLPVVCLLAAQQLRRQRAGPQLAAGLVLALQVALVWATKVVQDFR
ncbi:MAG: hypothetical protein H6732_19425 [Alphaproteobacteria bacterium]|nr:hypothetical protein [Alphaproteobacteria bacterium]